MELRTGTKGFAPVFNADCRALVLGSYPSPKSFEYGFYYGHPQNRFWPLVARLCGEDAPQDIPAKRALLLRHGIALWDSLESCDIMGAADTTIQNPVPNDIAGLLAGSNISAVFCNGAASHRFYTRYNQPHTGLAAVKLPSTSPANAAFSPQRLYESWQPLAACIKGGNGK